MRLSIFKGAAPAAPTFDAADWFAKWSDHGGVAILAGSKLHLSRGRAIDAKASRRLDLLRGELFRQRGGEAVKAMLAARRQGEVG